MREDLVAVFGDSIFRVCSRLAMDHALPDPGRKFLMLKSENRKLQDHVRKDRFHYNHLCFVFQNQLTFPFHNTTLHLSWSPCQPTANLDKV
jgi:hypothetical protein